MTRIPAAIKDLGGEGRIRKSAVAAFLTIVAYFALQLVWPTPAGVVVQGIVIGTLTALISFGIALLYRSNRIINFAQADLGLVPATLGIMLLTKTRRDPNSLELVDEGWPYVVCMLIAIAAAIALGSVVERLVIRRFSKAPRLILMVVTIGLAQILVGIGSALPYLFTDTLLPTQRYPSPFDFSFEISPIVFRGNDLLAVLFAGTAIAALFAFLRFTHIGVAVRASAESSERAGLLGVNVGLIHNVTWVIAAVMSTVAMLLRGGILGLPLGSSFGPALMLRALAAAVIGRMENFGVMFAAACGLGILEMAIIWNEDSGKLVDPVLFVVVIAALLLQRRRRESRVEDQSISSWQTAANVRPLPRELAALPIVRWAGRGLIAIAAIAALAMPLLLDDSRTNLVAAVFIYAMIGISLVVLTGWAGEISLGQVAFVGIGAATAGSLNVHYRWDLTLTLLAAGAIGAVVSVIVGLPALRIRGLFFAVATLAFSLATSSFILDSTRFSYLPDNVTERVERLPLLGRLDISSETAFYYVCFAAMIVAAWLARSIQGSRVGRILIATRENSRGAQAYGVSLIGAKLMAFAFAGFFASFAGGLFALHQQAVGQEFFAPAESLRVLTMVVVGGLGSIPGAFLGALFLKSTEWFNTLVPQDFRALFTFAGSGIGLVFVLWFLPGGLGSLMYNGRDFFLRIYARRNGIVVPSLLADVSKERAALPVVSARRVAAIGGAPTQSGPPKFLARFPQRPAPVITYRSFPDLVLPEATASELLSIRSLDVAYGQVQVLFGVDLDVREGEVIALLGTNGAGKSTVLRAISGLVTPTGGSVVFQGVDLAGIPPHSAAALGAIQVPGGRGIFPSLSVSENLRLAGWMFKKDQAYIREATEEVSELFPILREKWQSPAATLSGGQQQMLTLGMAFIAKPKLLMIDELSLGLAPVVVEALLKAVRGFIDRGTTVILVEQSVNVALTVADTAYFMEKGEIRFHGPTAELLERTDVLRSVYLQGATAHASPNGARQPAKPRRKAALGTSPAGQPILETVGIRKSFSGVTAINDLSITLHEGEILGIIGPNGAGKTTLFDLISGFLVPDEGEILFQGAAVTSLNPEGRSRRGLARSFQDARMFGALTVHQNIAVALDRRLPMRDPIGSALRLPEIMAAEEGLGRQADELISAMGLDSYRDKFVSELSTGSRRIVDLACLIGLEPKVILFDEPSSGIAQRETEALGPLLMRIREATGASLLVIEHDMPMITSISDRIIALDLGAKVVEGDAESVLAHPHVVASYLGATREVIERSGVVAAGAVQ